MKTVIIGAGQAGLATGYHLARRKQAVEILDANERVGDSWRERWDSLRLFSPAKYDGLPGWRFPAPRWSFPTKDEMGDYLEAYAQRFELPVRTGVRVSRLSKQGGRFAIEASGGACFTADRVVVASGAYAAPHVPAFAAELDPDVVQLHSSEYRNPGQLREGGVLVVGAGNSGAEIAYELVAGRPTWISGREVSEVPVEHGSPRARLLLPVIRFLGHRVLTRRTPIGRKVGPRIAYGATPLIRRKSADLAAAGVERVPRVTGVRDGLPELEDGRVLDVANVIWSTGFHHDFPWIDLPVFDEHGHPDHDRGVVKAEPGLYFVGQPFLYAATSAVLPGIGRDARYVARHIASLPAAGRRGAPTPAYADA
ncbi:MAG TPA: NAD(P)-binding domain-containing protein [Gaiellaceae bacterium]|jgi:putative flavoprotein involved in K+ transport